MVVASSIICSTRRTLVSKPAAMLADQRLAVGDIDGVDVERLAIARDIDARVPGVSVIMLASSVICASVVTVSG